MKWIIAVALASAPACLADARSVTAAGDGVIREAIQDAGRPSADTVRDADRKPQETLSFLALKRGMVVADYASGGGYFTRLFSSVVGPEGHVYASVPASLMRFPNIVTGLAATQAFAQTRPNVSVNVGTALEVAKYPVRLDVFWIAQNYHDLHDDFMGPVDMMAFNRAVYAALKPGGSYVILDHAAAPGSPANVTDTLHRIQASTVRKEVEAAGFRFVGESKVLANPADPHTAGVFDSSIRGRTDQFILRFSRPA